MSKRQIKAIVAFVAWGGCMWMFGATVAQKSYATALETRQIQLDMTVQLLAYTQAELKACIGGDDE